jgi:FkbM family methyltransferase
MAFDINRLVIEPAPEDAEAVTFSQDFLNPPPGVKRYVLGRNVWAESIARAVDVDGFIDDFAAGGEFLGRPVIRIDETDPALSLIVSANVLGRPWTVARKLNRAQRRHLDYFALRRYSGLPLLPVTCWETFNADFAAHPDAYHALYATLADAESRYTLYSLINFKRSADLSYMRDFADRQREQYFEPFITSRFAHDTFADVGAFDGFTARQFIRHCPSYRAVHAFEPLAENMKNVQANLAESPRITFHSIGASDRKQTLRFEPDGSASRISETGSIAIAVDRLDDRLPEGASFIKMDIEGGEFSALTGAERIINEHHPTLAVCVYHHGEHYRTIPERVLSYRSDYRLYLRHYTEGVTETVTYFVPRPS